MLILSRNLTFDRCWDTVARLDEAPSGVRLDPLASFIHRLPSIAVGGVSPHHRERVRDVARTIASARFAVPEGFNDIRLHALGLSRSSRQPLPRDTTRLLVVSPFLAAQQLRDLPAGGARLTVVSRAEQLDAALSPADGVQAFELAPDFTDATGESMDGEPSGASRVGHD